MIALCLLLLASPETERMLCGPSPFFRREGAERALREGDFELLLKAAKSPHWDARRIAATVLGKRTPVELLGDPVAAVREAAASALDTAAPVDALRRLLTDPDDAVRAAAVWASRGRRMGKELRALARDPSPAVRFSVLAATGNTSRLLALSKQSKRSSQSGLSDSVAAFAVLGRIGGPSEAANLIARLSTAVKRAEKDKILPYYWVTPRADIALARAVGDLARRGVSPGGKDIGKLLDKIIQRTDLNGPGGVLLGEAVAGARDAEAARNIIDAQIRARKTSTRVNAYFNPALRGVLHAFSRERWSALAPLLLPLLEDRDPFVRIAVVEALNGDAALPALRDPDPRVRVAALRKVRRVAAVNQATRDESVEVRRSCAAAFARIASPDVAPGLRRLLKSEHATVRLRAVAALLRVAIPKRTDALFFTAMHDPNEAVRKAATAVLAFLDEPDALPRAIKELRHDDADVRRHVQQLVHGLTTARIPYDAADPGPGAKAWEGWWERRKQRARAPDAFRYHVEDLRRRGLDLVLVIDATGSMAPVIQATKRRIHAVMNRLRDIVPNLRVRVVAYRDKGDAFLTLSSPLTHDARVLEDFLACVPATGGGDAPEAVLDGLRAAMTKTPWRNKSHRVVLLFGDAPPHERDLALLEALVTEFKGTVHTVHATRLFLAGEPSATADAFTSIAKWGRGSFVHMRDEDDLLRALLVLALGPSHAAAVETLFGL